MIHHCRGAASSVKLRCLSPPPPAPRCIVESPPREHRLAQCSQEDRGHARPETSPLAVGANQSPAGAGLHMPAHAQGGMGMGREELLPSAAGRAGCWLGWGGVGAAQLNFPTACSSVSPVPGQGPRPREAHSAAVADGRGTRARYLQQRQYLCLDASRVCLLRRRVRPSRLARAPPGGLCACSHSCSWRRGKYPSGVGYLAVTVRGRAPRHWVRTATTAYRAASTGPR